MRNRDHLALDTPNTNLVPGMAWLQSTYTTPNQTMWPLGLLEVSRGCRRKMTKKNRAGGSRAGDVRSAPFGSKLRDKQLIQTR